MNISIARIKTPLSLVVTLVCVGIVVCYPLFDYDLYWHMANGREMVSSGRIVNEEIFSYTKLGTVFSNHEWLSQILLYAVYREGDGAGLMTLKISVALISATFLFGTARVLDTNRFWSGFITVLAIAIGVNRFSARPELFSLLGVVVLGFLLHAHAKAKLRPGLLYALPAIMVIWDWLHGAIYGVVYLVLFGLGENIKCWIAKHRRTFVRNGMKATDIVTLNRALVATAVAMLINPYGLLSYDIFLEFIRGNELSQIVSEFAPPTWKWNALFFVTLGLVFAAVAIFWRTVDLTHIALLIPFAVVASRYERATAIFGFVAAPVLATLLPRLGEHVGIFGWRRASPWVLAGILFTSLATYLVYIKLVRSSQIALGYKMLDDGLPVGTARFIFDVGIDGNMYNSGHLGGYLAYMLSPQRRIFQYNHHTVFGNTLHYLDHPGELNRWNINYAVVGFAQELERLFPISAWAPLYHENGASLVVRRSALNNRLIQSYETQYYLPFRYTQSDYQKMADDAVVLPRLMYEMSTYLAYRTDNDVSTMFVDLMEQGAALFPNSQREFLFARAKRYNHID